LKRALEEEPNSVDAMRGLTDIYSKRHGVPHTAIEEQRQKEIERARELYYKNEDYGIG
jgi:hypothetical protein